MLNQEKNNATITFSSQILNKILNIFKKYYIKMYFIRYNILINILKNKKKQKFGNRDKCCIGQSTKKNKH